MSVILDALRRSRKGAPAGMVPPPASAAPRHVPAGLGLAGPRRRPRERAAARARSGVWPGRAARDRAWGVGCDPGVPKPDQQLRAASAVHCVVPLRSRDASASRAAAASAAISGREWRADDVAVRGRIRGASATRARRRGAAHRRSSCAAGAPSPEPEAQAQSPEPRAQNLEPRAPSPAPRAQSPDDGVNHFELARSLSQPRELRGGAEALPRRARGRRVQRRGAQQPGSAVPQTRADDGGHRSVPPRDCDQSAVREGPEQSRGRPDGRRSPGRGASRAARRDDDGTAQPGSDRQHGARREGRSASRSGHRAARSRRSGHSRRMPSRTTTSLCCTKNRARSRSPTITTRISSNTPAPSTARCCPTCSAVCSS